MSDKDPFIYDGIVKNNRDPEGRKRVKIFVPGVLEPESNWALPMGTIGGGSVNRGGFLVPAEGAIVGVYGCAGDLENPRYFCGYWPQGALPEENANGDPDVFSLSLGGIRFTLSKGKVDTQYPDGRGYARLACVPGDKGTYLELDGEKNSALLRGLTNLFLYALGQVSLDGITIQLYRSIYKRIALKIPRPF